VNWRRRQLERVERREVVHTKETFGEFFPRWLTRRKPYLEDGSWSCYERDGRIRLLPALESVPLGMMEVGHVRDLMDVMTEGMKAGEIAPKTVNNTLTTLVVCLNEAKKDKLMVQTRRLRFRSCRTCMWSASTCGCMRSRSTSTRAQDWRSTSCDDRTLG
jgi:hypothetical protein